MCAICFWIDSIEALPMSLPTNGEVNKNTQNTIIALVGHRKMNRNAHLTARVLKLCLGEVVRRLLVAGKLVKGEVAKKDD